jgi:hypothetical protein
VGASTSSSTTTRHRADYTTNFSVPGCTLSEPTFTIDPKTSKTITVRRDIVERLI